MGGTTGSKKLFNRDDVKVMLEHSLHSVLIRDIPTVRFQLDCSRAAVCPCTVFRVRCRPHSEGCELSAHIEKYVSVMHDFFIKYFWFLKDLG